MRIRRSWLSALLLSLSAHLGLLAALAGSGGVQTSPLLATRAEPALVGMRFLIVPPRLAKPLESAAVERRSTEGAEVSPAPVVESRDLVASEPVPVEPMRVQAIPVPPVLALLPAHYFLPDELTERPRIFPDTAPHQTLVLPDVFPQPAIVHLLINEQGNIDKVLMEETFLSEPAKDFVLGSFAKARFSPGKLGGKAVKSRLVIEVRLEGVLSLQ